MTDPNIILETERLAMRPYTMDDLDELVQIRSDPDVNRFLGGPERQNREALEKRLPFYIECYEKFSFAMCAMIWKETGEVIGSSGLQPLEDTGEIEVGYNLKSSFWRRGIGYECARGWLRYGFDQAGLDRIVAVTEDGNIGSWRIMEKCGMKFEGHGQFYGNRLRLYGISKEEFAAAERS